MSAGYDNPPVIAGGVINAACFITLETNDFAVSQSATGDMPFGISQDASELAPAFSQSAAAAAAAGDQVPYYGEGQTCLLVLGTGGATVGNLLMPAADGSGNGIVHTGSNWYGAMALQTGLAGEKIKVKVRIGYN